jgi:hypothetical protein
MLCMPGWRTQAATLAITTIVIPNRAAVFSDGVIATGVIPNPAAVLRMG